MKSWQAIILYIIFMITVFIYNKEILSWVQESHLSVLTLIVIAFGFAVFPVIPYKIIIGLLGFMYGPLIGALISLVGAWLASMTVYLGVRYYFQKQGRNYISRSRWLEKLTQIFERNPFIALLFLRIIPFIPQTVVNVYAAATSVRFLTYASASVLGKLPGMLVYAFIGRNLLSDRNSLLMAVGVYALFLGFIYAIYRLWIKELMK
jgi:uncharacterized membrane protein YdjX (TVP38/TMEM64 family)